MSKALKWVGILLGGCVLLLILLLLVAPMFIDVQKYKPRIEEEVTKATGRSFSIGGDLKLSLFPWAGIAFSDLRLGNPQGFKGKDFISVKSFDIQVKLLPLLSRDIQVKRFVVVGPRILMERTKDGISNWAGLGKRSEKVSPKKQEEVKAKPEKESLANLPIKGLEVGECAVREGEALWIDHATGTRREIKDFTLELKDVSLDRPIQLAFSAKADGKPLSVEGRIGPLGKEPGKGALPMDFLVKALNAVNLTLRGTIREAAVQPQFDLTLQVKPFSPRKIMSALGQAFPVQTKDPEALTSLAVTMALRGNPQRVSISDGILDLDTSKITFTAEAKDFSKPDLTFKMILDKVDVDRYLPPPSEEKPDEKEKTPATQKKAKTDYGSLRKPILDGDIRIGELKVMGATLQQVQVKLRGRNGLFHVDPFAFRAYQGNMLTKATLDVRGDVPKTNVNMEGKNFQVRPLIQDVLHKDFLEGITYTQMDLSMEGDDPDRIKQTLKGKGDLQFRDGAIIGIDLTSMIQNLKASFGLAEKAENKPRTDFAEFQVPFEMKDGIANTSATRLVSPILRVQMKGNADLVKENLNFRIEPKFVGTLKGQGDTKERGGIMVPVIVSGTFSNPTFSPDLKGMLKQSLEGGIKQMLEGKGDTQGEPPQSPQDTIKGILKGFGGKQ